MKSKACCFNILILFCAILVLTRSDVIVSQCRSSAESGNPIRGSVAGGTRMYFQFTATGMITAIMIGTNPCPIDTGNFLW